MSIIEQIERGDLEGAADAIEQGAPVGEADALGRTPLHHAASANATRLLLALLSRGVDPEQTHFQGQTPLHFAAGMAAEQAARVLLESGAKVDAHDAFEGTPLHALANGTVSMETRSSMVALLVSAGCPINAQDTAGRTALFFAVSNGSIDLVKALLAQGADPTVRARGTQGDCLDAAKPWPEVVQLLGKHR